MCSAPLPPSRIRRQRRTIDSNGGHFLSSRSGGLSTPPSMRGGRRIAQRLETARGQGLQRPWHAPLEARRPPLGGDPHDGGPRAIACLEGHVEIDEPPCILRAEVSAVHRGAYRRPAPIPHDLRWQVEVVVADRRPDESAQLVVGELRPGVGRVGYGGRVGDAGHFGRRTGRPLGDRADRRRQVVRARIGDHADRGTRVASGGSQERREQSRQRASSNGDERSEHGGRVGSGARRRYHGSTSKTALRARGGSAVVAKDGRTRGGVYNGAR